MTVKRSSHSACEYRREEVVQALLAEAYKVAALDATNKPRTVRQLRADGHERSDLATS